VSARRSSDPRVLRSGGIAGPGGPHDRGAVVVDTTNAVLLDHCDVALVDGAGIVAMSLAGRINRSADRAKVLFLFDTDGAAAIITELLGLMGRAGAEGFLADLDARMAALASAGHLHPPAVPSRDYPGRAS
jgi:hypothetical protein